MRKADRSVLPLVAVAALAFAGLLFVGTRARAQEAAPPPEARQFFESARAHYGAGRYPQAAEDLELALSLDPTAPTLVYNLSRVYELMGRFDRAVGLSRRYMSMLPREAEAERDAERARIVRMQGGASTFGTDGLGVPALREPEVRYVVRERGRADGLFYALLAGAVVAAGTGLGLALTARRRHSDAKSFVVEPPSGEEGGGLVVAAQRARHAALRDEARALGRGADISLVLGAALGISALVAYFARYEEGQEASASGWTPWLAAGTGGVAWGSSF